MDSASPIEDLTLLDGAARNDFDIVQGALANGANVNAADNHGNTALHFAVDTGNRHLIRFLIESGANVNARTSQHFTPLHRAAYHGDTHIVILLISSGADINAKDDEQSTPIDWAAETGNSEVIVAIQRSRDSTGLPPNTHASRTQLRGRYSNRDIT